MKVEYIVDGTSDAPMVRIYGYSRESLSRLTQCMTELARGAAAEAYLLESDGFHLINLKAFKLGVGTDQGSREYGAGSVSWYLSEAKWRLVCELLEGMANSISSTSFHQWLSGRNAIDELPEGEISVLVTNCPEGKW